MFHIQRSEKLTAEDKRKLDAQIRHFLESNIQICWDYNPKNIEYCFESFRRTFELTRDPKGCLKKLEYYKDFVDQRDKEICILIIIILISVFSVLLLNSFIKGFLWICLLNMTKLFMPSNICMITSWDKYSTANQSAEKGKEEKTVHFERRFFQWFIYPLSLIFIFYSIMMQYYFLLELRSNVESNLMLTDTSKTANDTSEDVKLNAKTNDYIQPCNFKHFDVQLFH